MVTGTVGSAPPGRTLAQLGFVRVRHAGVVDVDVETRQLGQEIARVGNDIALTTGPGNRHQVMMYGDGVKDVAFTVFDAEKAYEKALTRLRHASRARFLETFIN
jgi:4-hydroxyphenylpyruvate dioxygenase-like putative hemolysin